MENEISEQKSRLRKSAFAARKAVHGPEATLKGCAELVRCLESYPNIKIIAAYMSIRTEIDPLGVMTDLVAAGKKVCVPVIQGAGQALKFRQWTPDAKMVPGPFGAEVPESGDYLEPELLITPLLSFDRRGYRLGYGGGFYDRSFEGLRAKSPTVGIGFAYGAQEVSAVPTEPTDQPLDLIVTDGGVIRPQHP